MLQSNLSPPPQLKTGRNAWRYFQRAIRLRCPTCGISPVFLPLSRVENLTDWFETLEGCLRCGYVYPREPGYFLLALWVINFWIVAIFGVIEVLALHHLFALSTPAMMFITLISMWILSILTARHTKTLFLALDHYVHPYSQE